MLSKELLFVLDNPEKPVLSVPLRGRATKIVLDRAISWGKDTEDDDWMTPIFIIDIDLSEEDRKRGFHLRQIAVFGEMRSYGGNDRRTTEEFLKDDFKGTCLEGLRESSEIEIKGPLYRSDVAMFGGWSSRPLTEEETVEYTTANFGSVSSHTISLGSHPELRKLPSLSIKTAETARAILEEKPIALKDSA